MDRCYLNIIFPFDQTSAQEYQVKDDGFWWTNGLAEIAQRSWSHRIVWVRMDHTDHLILPKCQNHRCLYLDQDVPSPISKRLEGLLAWNISHDFAWRKWQLGLCPGEAISYSIHPIPWACIPKLQRLPIPGKPEAMLHSLLLHPNQAPGWLEGWKSHQKSQRVFNLTHKVSTCLDPPCSWNFHRLNTIGTRNGSSVCSFLFLFCPSLFPFLPLILFLEFWATKIRWA